MIRRLFVLLGVAALVVAGLASPAHAFTRQHAGGQMLGLANHEGVRATLTIENPWVDYPDHFSLGQISGERDVTVGGVTSRQIVEMGWHVYPGIHGGSEDTRLFVSSFVKGAHKGYNAASGCIDYPGGVSAGDSLTALGHVGTSKSFAIWHTGSAWEFSYNGSYVCYIPDSVWSNEGVTFTTITRADWFGEVVHDGGSTEMGDGSCGSSATSPYTIAGDPAYITSAATIVAGSAVAANITTYESNPDYDVHRASNTTILYGGTPGAC